jgi:hypothetical protein
MRIDLRFLVFWIAALPLVTRNDGERWIPVFTGMTEKVPLRKVLEMWQSTKTNQLLQKAINNILNDFLISSDVNSLLTLPSI